MPRLTAPDTLRDARAHEQVRGALDSARDALDNARKSIDSARDSVDGGRFAAPDVDLGRVSDSIRRTIDDLMGRTSDVVGRTSEAIGQAAEGASDRMPDASAVGDRVPKRADLLAAVPGAVDVARRVPSLRELRGAAEEARITARDAALEAARHTPLKDHPAVKRGPGPLAMAFRIGLASLLAGGVAVVIANRDRIRQALADARGRAMQMASERGLVTGEQGMWSDSGLGEGRTVDDVLIIERLEPMPGSMTSELDPTRSTPSTLAGDQPTEDLDAAGWGTEGRPTSPRQLSSDVASMTNPSPAPNPDELGE